MSENDVLRLISDFVDRARMADDYAKVKRCVNDALDRLQSVDISRDDAIHMLTTAITSGSEQNEVESPNLFQVFIELDRRKTRMAVDIMPLLTSAGSLPLAELSMRSGGPPAQLLEQLKLLAGQGLIEVEGGVPDSAEDIRADRRRVRLTIRGTRRAFR